MYWFWCYLQATGIWLTVIWVGWMIGVLTLIFSVFWSSFCVCQLLASTAEVIVCCAYMKIDTKLLVRSSDSCYWIVVLHILVVFYGSFSQTRYVHIGKLSDGEAHYGVHLFTKVYLIPSLCFCQNFWYTVFGRRSISRYMLLEYQWVDVLHRIV